MQSERDFAFELQLKFVYLPSYTRTFSCYNSTFFVKKHLKLVWCIICAFLQNDFTTDKTVPDAVARVGRVSKPNVTAPKTFSAWLFLSPERLISLSLRNVFKSSTLGFLEMSSTLLQFSKYCAFAKENQHVP